jgi:hypothetical protein
MAAAPSASVSSTNSTTSSGIRMPKLESEVAAAARRAEMDGLPILYDDDFYKNHGPELKVVFLVFCCWITMRKQIISNKINKSETNEVL